MAPSLSTRLREVGRSMVDAAYSAAIRPVTNQNRPASSPKGVGGLVSGLLPFEKGAERSRINLWNNK